MIELTCFLYSSTFVLSALIVLYLAKSAFDLAAPFRLKDQLTENDNSEVGIVLCGYLLGVIAVLEGSFMVKEKGQRL